MLLVLAVLLDWSAGQQQPVLVTPNRDFQQNRPPGIGPFGNNNPNLNSIIDPFSSRRPSPFGGDANTNLIFEEP